MSDILPVSTEQDGPNTSIQDATPFSMPEITTLNGIVVALQKATRVILSLRTAASTAVDLTGDAANGLDVDVTRSALPTGASTETTLAAVLAKIIAAPASEAKQDLMLALLTAIDGHVDGLEGKDYATQTTSAAILAKLIAAPATEGKQDAIIAALNAIDGHVDGLEGKDFATQTTLAAVLAKIIAAPATEAKQDTANTSLASILAALQATIAVSGPLTDTQLRAAAVAVSAASLPLPTGASTSANQATGNASLASIDSKIPASPATEGGNLLAIASAAGTTTDADTATTIIGRLKKLLTLFPTSLGQKTMAASLGVVIASDQASIPVASTLQAGSATVGAVNVKPTTAGGLTTYHAVAAASTNAVRIKSTAGQVFGWYIYNSNASARKAVLYNNANNPPVPGTDTPKLTIVIPGGSGANVEFTNGVEFDTGIGIAMVTGLADNDSTAVALNDLVVNIFYK